MNYRRKLIIALGAAPWPLARAQQPKLVYRVGYLTERAPEIEKRWLAAFVEGMAELGYIEGRNVVIEQRHANLRVDKLPELVAELVRMKVDVLVATGGTAVAAKKVTQTIPIVSLSQDPVAFGLAKSLARPGGHVTGVTDQSVDLSAKRLEIITEAVPRAARIAVLWNASDRGMTLRYQEVEKAAQRLHVAVQPLGVREPDDFAAAFSSMTASRPDALVMVTDALTLLNRQRVIDFALTHRIPAMYEAGPLVQDGGLMSYGANPDDNFRLAAGYVDRIFKGSSPSTLPVQRPGRYYLTINLKTAKALGLTIPPTLLLRADQVIE